MGRPPKPAIDRFFALTIVDQITGCWLWQGVPNHNGYARFTPEKDYGQPKVFAHVYSYEKFNDPIDKTLSIDHTCEVTSCVNPNHLQQISIQDNILLGNGIAAINARKTCCSNGHLFSEENTYVYNNKRQCKICRRSNVSKYYWRNR